MSTLTLTADNFESTVNGNDILLVDFWAEWCGPCRAFGPIFEKVSDSHPDVVFGKLDTDAEQQIAGALGIRSIPTLMAFRGGIMIYSQPGAVPEHALEQLISAVRNLDMEDVRRQIEERGESEASASAS